MFYAMSHDTVRRLSEERLGRTLARTELHRRRPEPPVAASTSYEAEVIELVFGAQCEPDEAIGA